MLSAPHFIATKLEAFKGRGKMDYLGRADIEDVCVVFGSATRCVTIDETLKGGTSSMMLRGWLWAMPLCALLVVEAGCGDEEGDTSGDSGEDGGMEAREDAGEDGDDAAVSTDADAATDELDGGAPEGGQGKDAGSDASARGDASAVELDQDGFPVLPSGMTNIIFLSISNSSSQTLADGLYTAPFSPNASSGTTLTYLDSSYIFTMMPSLQVQMRLTRAMADGSFECEAGTEVLVRYGKPPSGNNQLLMKSCTVTYHYDAGKNEYTGTIEAVLGDGLTSASEEATADATARFAVIGSNK